MIGDSDQPPCRRTPPSEEEARDRHYRGAPRHARREPHSHRDHPRHRLVVPLASPAVGPDRSGHRQSRSGNSSAALGPGAGAEVRGAQGPAHPARHAHRAAAPRPVGARARARRDQQEPAGPAVADRGQAGGDRFHHQRLRGVAAVAVRLCRQPRSHEVVQASGGDPGQSGSERRQVRRSRQVFDQGCAERSRGAATRTTDRRLGVGGEAASPERRAVGWPKGRKCCSATKCGCRFVKG